MAVSRLSAKDFFTALSSYESLNDAGQWDRFQQRVRRAGPQDFDRSYFEAAIESIADLKGPSTWRFVSGIISDRICDRCPADLVPALINEIVTKVLKSDMLSPRDRIGGVQLLQKLLCCYPEYANGKIVSAFDERCRMGSVQEKIAAYSAIAKIMSDPETPKKIIPFDMASHTHAAATKSGLRSVREAARQADDAICASDPAYIRYLRREIPKRVAEPVLRILKRHICSLN